MAFYDKFPYTNFQEINLDVLIRKMLQLESAFDSVIQNAALKYANPIQWSITTQYQANTVVIDPATGIAYLSTQPVPVNVLITNTDYWTPIFDLSQIIDDYDSLSARMTAAEQDISALQIKPIRVINLLQYGAHADGITDDSDILNDAIDNADIIYIPAGTYLINKTVYLSGKANKYILGESGTELIFTDRGVYDSWTTGTQTYYAYVKLHDCDNITFDSVNMHYTSVIADSVERLLVDISGGINVTIKNSNIIADAGASRNTITPIWARHHANTRTSDRVTIENCLLENLTGANAGGCFWNSSSGKNIHMNNCTLIHSTGDEALVTWGDNGYPLSVENTVIRLTKVNQSRNVDQAAVAWDHAVLKMSKCTIKSEAGNVAAALIRAHTSGIVYLNECDISLISSIWGSHMFAFTAYGEIHVSNSVINYTESNTANNPVIYAAGQNGVCTIDACTINYQNTIASSLENTREFINVKPGTTFKMSNTILNFIDSGSTQLARLRNIIDTSCKYFMMNNNIYNTNSNTLQFNSFGAEAVEHLSAVNNITNSPIALTPLWNQ